MMAGNVPTTALEYKEEGNALFKTKKYTQAIKVYQSALELSPEADLEVTLRRNMAVCHINMKQPEEALKQCKYVLARNVRDGKALYREAQAYEQMGRTIEAVQSLRRLLAVDRTNRAGKEAMARLMADAVHQTQAGATIKALVTKLSTESKDKELRPILEQIVSMAKVEDSSLDLFNADYLEWAIPRIASLTSQVSDDVSECIVRSLVAMGTHPLTANELIVRSDGPIKFGDNVQGSAWLHNCLQSTNTDLCRTSTSLLCTLHTTLSTMAVQKSDPESEKQCEALTTVITDECNSAFLASKYSAKDPEPSSATLSLLSQLEALSSQMSPSLAQTLIIKHKGTHTDGLSFSDVLINVLSVHRNAHVRLVVSAVVSRVLGSLSEEYQLILKQALLRVVVQGLDAKGDIVAQTRALSVINVMFVASLVLGIWLLDTEGVFGKVLDCYEQQKVEEEKTSEESDADDLRVALLCGVSEALSHYASNKSKCIQLLKNGVTQLHELYMHEVPEVSVRALVGLSRVMSAASLLGEAKELTSEMSVSRLYEAAATLVKENGGDEKMGLGETRRWAIECLAVQSINADVKDLICADKTILKFLMDEMHATRDLGVGVGLASMVQNITCSTRKKHLTDEQKELQSLNEFAKDTIEREQANDSAERIEARVAVLTEADLLPALVQLASTSESSLTITESIARVLVTVAAQKSARGRMVASGAHNTLLRCHRLLGVGMQMESEKISAQDARVDTSTPTVAEMVTSASAARAESYAEARDEAAQGLARIAITQDPNISFPGQKCYELIRPLMGLLGSLSELKVFEGLLALTNLSSMGEQVQTVILKEGGLDELVRLQLDDNELIQRSATECLCNMLQHDEVFDEYAYTEGSRFGDLRLWTLLCGSEEEACVMAASGGIAQLTRSPFVCDALCKLERGYEGIQELMVSPSSDVAYRGLYILQNILSHENKEHAKAFAEQPNSVEILSALVAKPGQAPNVKHVAEQCVVQLVSMGIIVQA